MLGCTQPSARSPRFEYGVAELRQEILRRAPRQPTSDLVIPFEIDAEAIEKARRIVVRRSGGLSPAEPHAAPGTYRSHAPSFAR